MSCLVALDAGASEIKASVFASDGRERGGASRDCPSDAPAPGWAQCGGEVLTEWPLQVLRDAVADAGVRPDEIDAIGVTGSRATVLPIGAHGSPAGPVIFWYDRRAQAQAAALERTLGAERFLALTGIPLDPTPSATKMMWLREHRPEVAAAATTYAIPQTVVLNRLAGGGWWCDESYGPYVGLMDLNSRRWSDELLAAAQVDAGTLPELVAPGTVVGPLSPAAAEAAGIAAGVPVVASGSDAACFKIGAGIEETGIASIYIGTAGVLGVITDRPVMDPRLTCCPSALPGYWDAEGLLLTAGSAYRWVRELVSDPERAGGPMSFAELDALAGQAPAGSDGLLVVPHLAGAGTPLWRSDAAGQVLGVRLSHGRSHLARAVLEGVAYAQRHALMALQECVARIDGLRFTGGGAASTLWSQILADVTGLPVTVPESRQSTALGAALIAGVAAGVYADHRAAIAAVRGPERRFTPEAAHRAAYDAAFRSYLRAAEGG